VRPSVDEGLPRAWLLKPRGIIRPTAIPVTTIFPGSTQAQNHLRFFFRFLSVLFHVLACVARAERIVL
jgi:hypothetical protein